MKDKMSIRRANKLLITACELYPELKDRSITITQDSKGVFYADVGMNMYDLHKINVDDDILYDNFNFLEK